MRKARLILVPALPVAIMLLVLPLTGRAQNREKFVISARAGGVNAVTGRASMRHGNTEWRQLTIKEDLEAGDIVKTDTDGRVEMLLNPGSYMRIGEDSEFELSDNSLENLEVRLIRGTAIVEVTGATDDELFIGITTPHTRMSIIRRGLYRVNVLSGDSTELIVRKGRVMLEGSHTKVKGGNKVVFSSGTFSVAKLEKADKDRDTLELWSKDRAQTLAKANSKISGRMMTAFASSLNSDWSLGGFGRRPGFWLFNPDLGCYTLMPFGFGWSSPYGGSYSRFFFGSSGGYYHVGRQTYGFPVTYGGAGGQSASSGTAVGAAPTYNAPSSPSSAGDRPIRGNNDGLSRGGVYPGGRKKELP
ncbi:MAG TPA: FecR domain-containing protein [Pyrinomonadaceae bacterium]|nr:FecR domain-containing protein [Pyrinomonadaceae bacterium]